MDPTSIDIRDRRGRLRRLGLATTIGIVATAIILYLVRSVAVAPNSDPVAAGSVVMMGIGLFVVITSFALAVISRRHTRASQPTA